MFVRSKWQMVGVVLIAALVAPAAASAQASPIPPARIYTPPGALYEPDVSWATPVDAVPREVILVDDAPLVFFTPGLALGPVTMTQYEPDGTVRWTAEVASRGTVTAAAEHPDGGAYVLLDWNGTSPAPVVGAGADAQELPATEAALARFDAAGDLDWVVPISGLSLDAGDLSVGLLGNAVFTGDSEGSSATFGSGPGATSLPGRGGFLASVAPDGQVLWARRTATLTAIDVAPSGRIWGTSTTSLRSFAAAGAPLASQPLPSSEYQVVVTDTGAVAVAANNPTVADGRLGPFRVPASAFVARFRPGLGWQWVRRVPAPVPGRESLVNGLVAELVRAPDDRVAVGAGGVAVFEADGSRGWTIDRLNGVFGLVVRDREVYVAAMAPLLGQGPFRRHIPGLVPGGGGRDLPGPLRRRRPGRGDHDGRRRGRR